MFIFLQWLSEKFLRRCAPCGLRELWFFVRIVLIRFLAGCRKRRLNRVGLVLLGLVFGVSCVYLWVSCICFGCCRFVCQYHSQVIGWKESSPK